MSSPTILIVDDDKSLQEFLEIFLSKEGFKVKVAGDGEEALAFLAENPADLILADIRMPRLDGISFLKALRERGLNLPVIMITAYASLDTAVAAKQEGAFDYVAKPFKLDELRKLIARALSQARGSSGAQGHEFMGLIGRSPAIRRVFEMIPRIANAPSNVLITGESGTGKELVARAIHQLSPRRDKPFVVVNCGGIPPNLLESELFGYKAGAFTGATRDKEGLFLKAHQGTIFLDEIGELPLEMQVKLLRVVQEKVVLPLGATKEIKIDVRIISATNRDLAKEVLEGNFREDLYYRLNVITLELPPLRERREDIPLLVDHFLKKYARKMGKEIQGISDFALKALMEYDFPGNVRELENIIERSVALETGPLILPENLVLSRRQKPDSKTFSVTLPENGLDLESFLAEIEISLLKQALARTGGNKTEAAKLLGLNFRSFRYRLAKYGLS